MIESPVIQELVAEVEHKAKHQAKHEDILLILESRFGSVSEDIERAVTRVVDEGALRTLIQQAARCQDIDAFRRGLSSVPVK